MTTLEWFVGAVETIRTEPLVEATNRRLTIPMTTALREPTVPSESDSTTT